jgi:glycosyltransferase involved in cell wall biosynthesis
LLRYTVSSVLRRADNVVAQSSDIRRKAATYYDISEEHIDIIPLPYEQTSFQETEKTDLKLSEDMSTLISVGRMVERKGYRFLLRAMVEIDDVELVLVGEGPKREQLMRLADRLDIQERVHFPGYVSEERKFQYLAASSVYVLSSLHEGFGIVVQEALQVGLPIVATDSGGQTDIIEDGVHGRIVETGSVDALVDGICSVLTSETEYEDRCKQRLEAYRPDRICRQYARLFDSTEV